MQRGAGWLFGAAAFLSAGLLFVVQPLAARIVLPAMGGSPAVWTTCMLYFQSVLLLGYLYAHLVGTRVRDSRQALVHLGVLVLAGATLPSPTDPGDPGDADPRWFVFRTLTLTVGPAFFALAASAPLLTRWYARVGDPARAYVLYAASNAGSLLGLLAYPLLIETTLARDGQALAWAAGFWALGACFLALAWVTRPCERAIAPPVAVPGESTPATPAPSVATSPDPSSITPAQRLAWVLLAAVPSALLLGVTQHISMDVVAAPLLWVVPLAIYLVTFIAAFSGRRVGSGAWWGRAAPWCVLPALALWLAVVRHPVSLVAIAHLVAFAGLAMLCHVRLAESRPHASRSTEFYLCLAAGGVVGGVLAALVAPAVFTSILEYPLAIAAALLLRPAVRDLFAHCTSNPVRPGVRAAWVLGAAALALAGWWGVWAFDGAVQTGALQSSAIFRGVLGLTGDATIAQQVLRASLVLPALALAIAPRTAILSASAFAGLLLGAAVVRTGGESLHRERTFFGVHEVSAVQQGNWHILTHGTTMHGVQAVKGDKRFLPTMYYHPSGPIGDVMLTLRREQRLTNVGVVGLGVGALAAYADEGMTMDFFEIDDAVIRIAANPSLFTYLSDAAARPGVTLRTFSGDGRVLVRRQPPGVYDLLVIDAFSSDAIPTHLLTREAVGEYVERLTPRGVLAFHISSRYFDLRPVLARVAQSHGMVAFVRDDATITPERAAEAKRPSVWVVLARSADDLGPLAQSAPRWTPLAPGPRAPLWTDDYSNVLGVLEGW
jgi:spermidine synthase